jgi:short-subunit dehydrogenase
VPAHDPRAATSAAVLILVTIQPAPEEKGLDMAKPIDEQVVVITGASSGIGRATALEFGRRGARVVLAARNEDALEEVADAIRRVGGEAHVVKTDVSDWPQVQKLAQEAAGKFGRIDTWINNAAVSEYAPVDEATPEEMARIVQVNLLGTIYGAKAALEHMRQEDAGTIINVGSELSNQPYSQQAAYAATKHGVKGFTDALRMELNAERSPIRVSLVMPSSINTPLFDHARSKLGVKPQPFPPVYEPAAVAEAILSMARWPQREIAVGGPGRALTMTRRMSPRLADWMLLRRGTTNGRGETGEPDNGMDNLFEPAAGNTYHVRGDFGGRAYPLSAYTRYVGLHPNRRRLLTGVALAGLAALAMQVVMRRNGNGDLKRLLPGSQGRKGVVSRSVAGIRDMARRRARQYRWRKAMSGGLPLRDRLRLLLA